MAGRSKWSRSVDQLVKSKKTLPVVWVTAGGAAKPALADQELARAMVGCVRAPQPVAYLGGTCGHGPPLGKSENIFWRDTLLKMGFQTYSIYFAQKCPQNARNAISETHISKWDFKLIYFAQKCPQNAGNAVSETQISKHFRGGMPLDPPTIVSSLWPPPH